MSPSNSIANPFDVLGLSQDSSESEIRQRYLELVKQFPPERDPAKFREIHAAYASSKDPLTLARSMIQSSMKAPQEWDEFLDREQNNPPPLSATFLVSLGNRNDK